MAYYELGLIMEPFNPDRIGLIKTNKKHKSKMAEDNSNRQKSGLADLFRPKPYGSEEKQRHINQVIEYVFIDDSLPPNKIVVKGEDLITAYEKLVKITKHPADFKLEQTI